MFYNIKKILELLRVKQWVKNLLIFAPLLFAGKIFSDLNSDISLITAFFSISFASSFIYVINDIIDKKNDEKHLTKKLRPIASGAVSFGLGILIAFICLVVSFILSKNITCLIAIYLVLSLLYCFIFKKYAIIDVTIISLGYVLRLFMGSKIADVPLTDWIIVITFLISLFLALAKRYDDVKNQDSKVRVSTSGYSVVFIEGALSMIAAITLVAYIIYTVSPQVISQFNSKYLYATSLFVLIGFLRYLQLTFVYNKSGSPTNIIYGDMFLKIDILLWFLSFLWIIY